MPCDLSRRALFGALPALSLAGCRDTQVETRGDVKKLLAAAHEQTRHAVKYDAAYSKIAYPMGDVPLSRGVCADVIIRAYRAIGLDLQQLVHEDMAANFDLYPDRWGLKAPDPNIDHRRVPNLRVFFARFGKSLPVTRNPDDYLPGDIITSRPITRPHIGIVSDRRAFAGLGDLMVIHNQGMGTRQDNVLLAYEITGHYRYGTA